MNEMERLLALKASLKAKAQGITAKESSTTDEINAVLAEIQALNAKIEVQKKVDAMEAEEILAAAEAKKAVNEPLWAQPKDHTKVLWKNNSEFLTAVFNASKQGVAPDPRLLMQNAASGMGESVPSDGGFLVGEDFAKELLQRTYETGILASKCRKIPISPTSNSLEANGIDEPSRANGSRWGGIQSYWENEADALVGTKPKFNKVGLKLKKLTGLCYATDELLQDSTALESIIGQAFAEEFGFRMDDAIMNGLGAGQPLGFMKSGALVTVTKEVGQANGSIVTQNILNMWARRLIEANYPLDKIQKIRETYLTPPNSQPGPGQDNGLHKGWDNGNGNSGSGNGNDNDNGSGNGNKHTQSNNFSLFSLDTVKSASLENWFYHIFGHGNGEGNGGGGNGGLNGNAGGNGNGANNGNENGNGNGNNGNHGDGNNGNHGDGNNGKINHHGNNGYGKAFGKDKAKQTKSKFEKTIMEEDLPAYMLKPQSKVQYTYDEAGNRLTMTDDDGTINYYYDDDNRLVSEGGNELHYNDAGNLIQKTDGNGTTNYSYDAAGRLAQVSLADGTSESYGYDAYGRKIFEAETYWQYTGNSKQLRNQTTSYLYQGETLLKEYTGEGSPLAEYYTANGRVIARNIFGFLTGKPGEMPITSEPGAG